MNVDSFLESNCGMIFVALCVESMHNKSFLCRRICSFCHGDRNATTTLASGLCWMCDRTCHPISLSFSAHLCMELTTLESKR